MRFKRAIEWLGRVGLAFVVLVLLYFILGWLAPQSTFRLAVMAGVVVTGVWCAIRVLRRAMRQSIWRLRDRLLVTYLFISGVPILLVAGLATLGGYSLVSQLAVYLVTSELQRRIDSLVSICESVSRSDPESRPAVMERAVDLFYRDRFPGIEILLREAGGRQIRYPEGAMPPAPLPGWQPTSGVLARDGRFYLWSYNKTSTGDITITAPITRDLLASLVPNLGLVDAGATPNGPVATVEEARGLTATNPLPPAANRFDPDVVWFATLPTDDWAHPGMGGEGFFIAVRSRVSAVLGAVFNRKADLAQGVLTSLLYAGLIVFVIVEIASWLIGIGMTHAITAAVHRLYEGTQKVIEGDFAHRIEVRGDDQLAELSRSFNRMTENVERLLVVAKEKERLQSEIEIAREVQDQLFPREVPHLKTLRVTAVCQPARLVSGDYYDYEPVGEGRIALAIADVAGKGISAALLMAALQSSLRAQLQSVSEAVPALAGGGSGAPSHTLSTSQLVSSLNRQLYATTSAEKYATFCIGVYDEPTSVFTYTNAGHLPPLLVRDGQVEKLDVNGTVVGAFPFAPYDESRVNLRPGDLLVFYTDGVTEPENAYGEMFGEDRLIALLAQNAHHYDENKIIEIVLDGVRHWTASDELQDDMTLLLARRV
ncbi:MAG: PP2C family protein-serine/threonine phosphatase [Bryobacterales bacterium]|nr:PP2C family protein-serine/threonine phosphatase [Bryobacterales bacterium]MBV9401976.1 PP2C family protein-serine/threonine phosphatase [Bryobacterales bacterium]